MKRSDSAGRRSKISNRGEAAAIGGTALKGSAKAAVHASEGGRHFELNAPKSSPAPRISLFLDPKGHVVVDRVVKRFGMSKQQFAETIGVKPETVYRASRVSAPKTQTRATEMLEIITRIADWAGGERQAMAWYRAEPIPAFGGRTAESLVKAGKAGAVRDYLDHIATGGFA
jgi:hypothetical protein